LAVCDVLWKYANEVVEELDGNTWGEERLGALVAILGDVGG
jgi:hypothetical protein